MRRDAPRFELLLPLSLLLALVLAAPRAARAADAASSLAEARKLYGTQEYEKAIPVLRRVAHSATASIKQKVDAFELLGLSNLILGNNKKAREAFENLLSLDPQHELRDPSGSPKLRKFYESVKASFVPGYKPGQRIELSHVTPTAARAGQALRFVVLVPRAAAAQVKTMVLRWRRGSLLSFRELPMRARGASGRRFVAKLRLPGDEAGYELSYTIEARGAGGVVLGHAGTRDGPLTLRVAASRPTNGGGGGGGGAPIYKRWWFWTIIGAVVVGGTVAGIAGAASGGSVPSGNLDPGKVTLPLVRF
ncbi:MAG: hypothetical protein KC503_43365 [Myxococcales bacterium]|nr:hypothetical protein [Myxococcales bacterium]